MSDPLDKLSWDDLRIMKAIGESGGLAAAATMLGVSNTTISRRLSRLEQVVGAALIDRPRRMQPGVLGASRDLSNSSSRDGSG
jgi:DNA-binding transcriptional LysR family regulator